MQRLTAYPPRGMRALAPDFTLTTNQGHGMAYEPNAAATDGERIASIETLVGDMHTRLFGNGQPGELDDIKSRLTRIESWFWRAIGGGAVILFLLERFK